MTLLEKLNKELEKVQLEFKQTKECNEKFNGILTDKQTGTQMPFEVWKSLQNDKIKNHAKWCREYMDNNIKLSNMMKGGKF